MSDRPVDPIAVAWAALHSGAPLPVELSKYLPSHREYQGTSASQNAYGQRETKWRKQTAVRRKA